MKIVQKWYREGGIWRKRVMYACILPIIFPLDCLRYFWEEQLPEIIDNFKNG